MSEKHSLPTHDELYAAHGGSVRADRRRSWLIGAFVTLALLAGVHLFSDDGLSGSLLRGATLDTAHLDSFVFGDKAPKCPHQPKPLHPKTTVDWTIDNRKKHSAELLSQAVQHDTQSYDDNGDPGVDERWEPFHRYLEWWRGAFPVAVGRAKVEMINTLGILATFEGSDPTLKPLVLMSHYDVVPAPKNTWDQWTHPPFSGHDDGTSIWGRGAADDKSLFVAQWEAVTYLLEAGWEPRRTLILSHGFDEEEVHARRGQGQIAPFLEKRYGQNGILMVVDEGSGLDDDFFGAPFALPAMGEKGYLDVTISVGTQGGHSSMPPDHTGIGILAEIIVELERNPFKAKLTERSPVLTTLACAAEYAPHFPRDWKRLLRRGPKGWQKLAEELSSVYLRQARVLRELVDSNFNGASGVHTARVERIIAGNRLQDALLRTTQAVDTVVGGVKINALPEFAQAGINYRIDFDESIESTKKHIQEIVAEVARRHRLELDAWPRNATTHAGRVTLSVLGAPLEPAPNTPAHGGVWDTFAGTVRAVYPAPKGRELIVAPAATTGNTDCKMYYNLTRNVYRFMGLRMTDMAGIHTVNEHTSVEGHRRIVDFVHALIQNVDGYDGDE